MSKNTKRPLDQPIEETVDPLTTEDKFLVSVVSLSAWIRRNRDLTVIALLAGVLGIAALYYYVDNTRRMVLQAATRLEAIHSSVAILALEDAKSQLSTFIDRFSGTNQADEAVVLLGRLHLEAGDFLVAISVLQAADLSMNTPSGVQANSLLARAFEAQGRWSDAETQHLKVASGSELEFEIRGSLESAARARIRQRDFTGAMALYEQILEELEEADPREGFYAARLAEISGSVN